MKLQVKRRFLGEEYTIGTMSIDFDNGTGWQYFSDTMEDKVRDSNKDGDLQDPGETKVYGKTAIPYGKYNLIITKHLKYGTLVPYLVDVKEFTGILIHAGSIPAHTEGCILVGFNKVKGQLVNSKVAFNRLMELFKQYPQRTYEIEVV